MLKAQVRPQEKLLSRHFLSNTTTKCQRSPRKPHPEQGFRASSSSFTCRDSALWSPLGHPAKFPIPSFAVSQWHCSASNSLALAFHHTQRCWNKNSRQGSKETNCCWTQTKQAQQELQPWMETEVCCPLPLLQSAPAQFS